MKVLIQCALQTFWNRDSTDEFVTEKESDDDDASQCYKANITSVNAQFRFCRLGEGLARLEVTFPHREDLSGNTGLCGNANGCKRDDPALMPANFYRLHPIEDDDSKEQP